MQECYGVRTRNLGRDLPKGKVGDGNVGVEEGNKVPFPEKNWKTKGGGEAKKHEMDWVRAL